MVFVHVTIGSHVFVLDTYQEDDPALWDKVILDTLHENESVLWDKITELISRWTENWDDMAFEICPITIIFTGGINAE